MVTVPEKPSLAYSYTGFQQGQGDNTFPGTQIDSDLAGLKQAIDETIDFTRAVIRDDGRIGNGSVTKSSLAPDILLGVAPPRQWTTATAYAVDDTVFQSNALYICTRGHTSGVFLTDLPSSWQAMATFTPLSEVSDGTITEPKHATGGVSARALADSAVTTAKHADASVTMAKLASDVTAALLPIGVMIPFAGATPPSRWLFAAGQQVSRATYPALFAAITASAIGGVTSGSPTITSVSVDLRGLGLELASIEGPGIPAGAHILSVSASTITLSVNATATNAAAAVRVFPHGNGDGSTTFTIPDRRGVVTVGRDTMGGTAANRVTYAASGLSADRLGALGGTQAVTLSQAQIPTITPQGTVSVTINNIAALTAIGTVAVDQGTFSAANGPVGSSIPVTTSGTSFTGTPFGGGQSHPNVQPAAVDNVIIYAGV